MKNIIKKVSSVLLIIVIDTMISCGNSGCSAPKSGSNPSISGGGSSGGSDEGVSKGSSSTGLASVKLNLSGAIGLVLLNSNSTSVSGKSVDAGSGSSNLGRVNQDNTLSNAVTSGSLMVQSFMVAPDNNVYLLLSSPIDSCVLVRIKGTDSVVTNEISCVDNTLTSVSWSNGFNEPIQFDGAGNIYYMGQSSDGHTILRENKNGIIIDLINDNISLNGFLVLYDGTVFITGSTRTTGISWTRIITPERSLQNFFNYSTSFLLFPDNNIYFSDWTRYLTATKILDTRPWIGDSQAYHTCPFGANCSGIKTIFKNIEGVVFAITNSALMQYYPSVLQVNTTVDKITVYKSILSYVILAGLDGDGNNKLALYDIGNDHETNLLGNENIEVYHVNCLAPDSTQIIMFDGLRFSDNQYVLCRVNLTDGNELVCSNTGTSPLTDFQLFNNSTIVGGNASSKKTYLVGGTVTGLYGTLVLSNNDGDGITLTENGSFNFSVAVDSNYDVKVVTNPSGQTCTVTNGSGVVVDKNITSISITCETENGVIVTIARPGDPLDLAFDSAGRFYYSNQHNINRMDDMGNITTVVTDVNSPMIAFDSLDNLYFTADCMPYVCVKKMDKTSGVITTVAGGGNSGSLGDGGPAISATIGSIRDIAFDSSNNLYIATGSFGQTFAEGVRKVDKTSGLISLVASMDPPGGWCDSEYVEGVSATSECIYPSRITFDSLGNLYIGDWLRYRILKINKTTGIVTTYAGKGTFQFSGDGGSALNAGMRAGGSMVFDSSDNLYFSDSDNFRVRKIDRISGIISTVAGNGIRGDAGDGKLVINAEFGYVISLVRDASGNLFFSDPNNNRIRMIAGTGN